LHAAYKKRKKQGAGDETGNKRFEFDYHGDILSVDGILF